MARQGRSDSTGDLFFIPEAEANVASSADPQREPAEASSSHEDSKTVQGLTAAELGARLKDARKRQGLSVSDVAKVLNFQNKIVRSIESGDLAQLPTSYEVGFFRTYAQFVGEPALGVSVCEAVGVIREDFVKSTVGGPDVLTDNLMPPQQTNWLLRIATVFVLIAGAVVWLAWPEGHADQRTTMGESEIPIQYTFDVKAID